MDKFFTYFFFYMGCAALGILLGKVIGFMFVEAF